MKHFTFSILSLFIFFICKGQKCDTSFYFNSNNIRSISCEVGKKKKIEKIVQVFNNINGENILFNGDISYEFYDEEHQKKRVINIKENILFDDFWYTDTDTLYNIVLFDENYEKQIQNFFKFLQQNLSFPQQAKNSYLDSWLTIVSAIIDKNGELTNIKAVTNHGFGLENEALRVVYKYKNWGIVTHKGKPVNLFIRFPIKFRLI